MKMKKLFITLTIIMLGFMVLQSCDNIDPQFNHISPDIDHIHRSGIDTSTTNIDTLTTK